MRNFFRIVILFSLFFLCFVNISVSADSMKYQVEPALIVLGETGNVNGMLITVNVTVSDAVSLVGLDIDFSWNIKFIPG